MKVECSSETLVSAYPSARGQLGTQQSNSYPLWWWCTLGDDELRVLVIIQVNSVGYLLTCRLNSITVYCTASTETQNKTKKKQYKCSRTKHWTGIIIIIIIIIIVFSLFRSFLYTHFFFVSLSLRRLYSMRTLIVYYVYIITLLITLLLQ